MALTSSRPTCALNPVVRAPVEASESAAPSMPVASSEAVTFIASIRRVRDHLARALYLHFSRRAAS